MVVLVGLSPPTLERESPRGLRLSRPACGGTCVQQPKAKGMPRADGGREIDGARRPQRASSAHFTSRYGRRAPCRAAAPMWRKGITTVYLLPHEAGSLPRGTQFGERHIRTNAATSHEDTGGPDERQGFEWNPKAS